MSDTFQLNPPRLAGVAPRILVVGSHLHRDGFEWHILDSLSHLACPVEFFGTRAAGSNLPRVLQHAVQKGQGLFLREPELLFQKRLLRSVQEFEPELILVTLGNQLSPKTVQRLRSTSNAVIVCWCQDSMLSIGRQFMLGAQYDAVFVKDRHMEDLFSRMIKSTSFHYLPEACNPRVHRSVELSAADRKTYGCDVMIAGSLYYYRQEILSQLTEFDLKIWGLSFDWMLNRLRSQCVGREVVADDKARAVAGAKVCLNTLHYAEINGLNCRAFEVAGCGGFQLITSAAVLGEHFAIGQEIVEFRSVDQLRELVRYYLDHPELAAEIAKRGQIRAHQEHTFEHRLTEIVRVSLGRKIHPA